MIDFITYIDTDSLFIDIMSFLEKQGISKKDWEALPDKMKIDYVIKLSRVIEEYVDTKAYEDTQKLSYNSVVEDFKIGFKQEVICKKALFVAKKKYGYHLVNKEGVPKDTISVTGLEIIRSETPTVFRVALKDILSMILKGSSDDEIRERIDYYRKALSNSSVEEISTNIGVKNIKKYIKKGNPIKGTPYHVKGVANYRKLLEELDIKNKYKDIEEESKNKVVYIKPNQWGIEVVTYPSEWPKEFEGAGIEADYQKMMEKYFLGKCEILLDPINKLELLDNSAQVMGAFF